MLKKSVLQQNDQRPKTQGQTRFTRKPLSFLGLGERS
ncbi:hypothetical protein N203_02265 [Helicobacter pylori UM084]|nr:hypothetical protein N203_02265 [Helicobacter pylori UM084]